MASFDEQKFFHKYFKCKISREDSTCQNSTEVMSFVKVNLPCKQYLELKLEHY